MKLVVNGQERICAALTLADLWREETEALSIASPKGFAIALNGSIVRRVAWPTTRLSSGDKVEIIRAMAGG